MPVPATLHAAPHELERTLELERVTAALDAGELDERAARDALEPRRRPCPAVELRALGDADAPGAFEAIFAVLGNVDDYGDRLLAGCFDRTLQPPPEGRGMPPVVWSHEWGLVPIGATLEAREVAGEEADELAGRALGIPAGIYAKARLLVADDEDHAEARKAWAAMRAKGGDGRPPLREFSFGFRTRKARYVEDEDEPNAFFGEVREVEDLELFEWGPTLVGANPATALLDAKHALTRGAAGRRQAADRARAEGRAQITAALTRRRHPHTGGIPR